MNIINIFKLCFLIVIFISVTGFLQTNKILNINPYPEYLIRTLDDDYNTWFRRVTGDTQNLISFIDGHEVPGVKDNDGNIVGALEWQNWSRHNYSKVQPWNANQTLLFIQNKIQGNPDSPVDNLFLDANAGGDTYKVKFDKSRPCISDLGNPDGEERWHPTDPNIRIYLGKNKANCAYKVGTKTLEENEGNAIGKWNVLTDEVEVIRMFPEYTRVQLGPWEGNLSDDGQWIAIVATKPNHEIVVFAFNLNRNEKKSEITLAAVTLDWASISPTGAYIVINGCWDSVINCKDATFSDRTLILKNDGTFVSWWGERGRPSHYDLTIDEDNEEVAVGVSNWNNIESGKVIKRNLKDGNVTVLTDISRTDNYKSYASHTSTRNIKRKGWAYVSYANNCGYWPLYCDELVAVKLDGTGTVERWIKMHQTPNDYESQPQAVPSPDGERVLWASKWSGTIGAYVAEH